MKDGDAMTVNEVFIRRAVERADLHALRMSLFQITGERWLLELPPDTEPIWDPLRMRAVPDPGGSAESDKNARRIRGLAVQLLAAGLDDVAEAVPADDELRTMLASFNGAEMTEAEYRLHRDELAFEPYPRAVEWSNGIPERATEFHVAIVGAGFSGIAAAVQLERLGIRYTIYERRSEIGGTWSINTYPDARVDTTSLSYQFSFEKKYPWSEYFARQGEVRRYLEYVAEKYNVSDHICFEHEIRSARFDGHTQSWNLEVAGPGAMESVTADFVVSASGLFSTAKKIEFDGIEDFAGRVVHTTDWSDEIAVAGRRVAVIGNGSTGVQLLSRIAESAAHVDVFVRTPQWISPRERYGEPIPVETRWLINNLPYYENWFNYASIRPGLMAEAVQEVDPEWQAQGGLISAANDRIRKYLTEYISGQLKADTDLVERLVPRHAPMARRLIVDNGWYRTLLRDNVELVTESIERFTVGGILTSARREYKADLVVAAVGFSVEKYVWPAQYRAADGTTLEETWADRGPRAYLGMAVPNFPNLFIMYGPNGQNRVGSLITHIESWAAYIAQCIVGVVEGGHRSIEVTPAACDEYNESMDEATVNLVWLEEASRDRNYYVDRNGRQSVGAPWRAADYYGMLSRPDFGKFSFG
ncbi:hypothetical protein C5E45_19570 [Nocardia nova]|uniref:Monooxygenase n=1 Tax=Nocardia nova TaxID=37330 RepID=A0A2S6AN19_9NOCA|nr:hypothetical protein C5E41_18960 [Nocardia nova]PPJ36614.1 hypothetical protein C5E45_19570 [Nocardia nova]